MSEGERYNDPLINTVVAGRYEVYAKLGEGGMGAVYAARQAPLGRTLDRALSERVEPLPDQPYQGVASTDVGDISWFVPVGQLTAATHTFGAPGHSWQIVACTGMSIGEKGMLVAARALAASAVDLYQSAALREKARADFTQVRDPLKFVTLIPEGQKTPTTIR